MAAELLQKKEDTKPFGVNWAMAQEPEILRGWFELFESIKRQYQIQDEDIYNMDEKGFMQGFIAKLRVIISKHEKKPAILSAVAANGYLLSSVSLWMGEFSSPGLSSRQSNSRRPGTRF